MIDKLFKIAEQEFNFTKEQLQSSYRGRDLVDIRRIMMRLLRSHTLLTSQMIGKLFNRDHATVLHALTKYDELIATDKAFIVKRDIFLLRLDKYGDSTKKDVFIEAISHLQRSTAQILLTKYEKAK